MLTKNRADVDNSRFLSSNTEKTSSSGFSLSKINKNIVMAVLIVLSLYAFIITILYLTRSNAKQQTYNALPKGSFVSSTTPTINQQSFQPQSNSPDFSMVRIYPSLNREFSLYIHLTGPNSIECYYGIFDREGIFYDFSGQMGTTKIECSSGPSNISSNAYKGWADGNLLIIENKSGEITVLDVKKFTANTINYDSNNFNFVLANRTLKYWLYAQKEKDGLFLLLDKNQNTIMDNLPATDRKVLYDEINDGFLFIKRNFSESKVSIKFDFLSLSDFSLKTILVTEPIEVPGHGCNSEYLVSKPKEIILTQGCLFVKEKYLDSDGYIHIKI